MKFEQTLVEAVDFSQGNAQLRFNGFSFYIRIRDEDQARWLGARINKKVTLTIEDPSPL